MICPICEVRYSAHDIELNGEILSVCNVCFENRPDDAIELNPIEEDEEDCPDWKHSPMYRIN